MNARSRYEAEAVSGVQSRRAAGPAEWSGERPAAFRAGEVIGGKYVLERVLGVGGVGVVVAARHAELDEMVAIKFLHEEMQQRPDIVRRFGVEARAAVRIKSEYAARVFDVGVAPGRGPYLVMEYLEGNDLAEVLAERGPLAPKHAVAFVLQACEALAVAHAHGIVHRDIKPENLFVARRGDGTEAVKVVDFGISKGALAGGAPVAQTQELMGSPLYMSPEQVRASASVDHRTDVWSLGVVLYEMLTGQVPFPGDTVPSVCARVLESEPPPASPAPEGLQAALRRALAKDPARRFQNVAELAISLLPFGPSWARVSAERTTSIVRASGQSVGLALGSASSAPPPSPATTLTSASRLEAFGASVATPVAGLATGGAALSPPPVPSFDFGGLGVPPPTPSLSPEALSALTSEARRTRRLVTAASTGALALAGLAVGLVLHSNRAAPASEAVAPGAGPVAAAEPGAALGGEVMLSLGATPAEAKLFLDDKPLGSNPYKSKVARDGLAHSLRAEAKGYTTRSVAVLFDADKDVTLGLDRAAAGEAGRGGAAGSGAKAGAGRRAAVAATPGTAPATSAPAAPSPAAPAEAPPKSVQEVDLSKSRKPVRAIDSGNMW
jgi:serine/threonine-protein kinase